MPGIYIYFPNAIGPNNQHFHTHGVGEMLGTDGKDQGPDWSEFDRGPDGNHGQAASWPSGLEVKPLEYRPDAQEWTQAGSVWLGRDKGQPVTPASLARRKQHQGRDVTLADSQQWHIPIARQLPHLLGLGKPRIHDVYKPFWERSVAALDWLAANDDGVFWDIPWQEENSKGFQFACAALAVNYRVCPLVVDWLGLLGTEEACRILETVTADDGIRRMLELQQKKSAQTESSTSSSPPIDDGEPA